MTVCRYWLTTMIGFVQVRDFIRFRKTCRAMNQLFTDPEITSKLQFDGFLHVRRSRYGGYQNYKMDLALPRLSVGKHCRHNLDYVEQLVHLPLKVRKAVKVFQISSIGIDFSEETPPGTTNIFPNTEHLRILNYSREYSIDIIKACTDPSKLKILDIEDSTRGTCGFFFGNLTMVALETLKIGGDVVYFGGKLIRPVSEFAPNLRELHVQFRRTSSSNVLFRNFGDLTCLEKLVVKSNNPNFSQATSSFDMTNIKTLELSMVTDSVGEAKNYDLHYGESYFELYKTPLPDNLRNVSVHLDFHSAVYILKSVKLCLIYLPGYEESDIFDEWRLFVENLISPIEESFMYQNLGERITIDIKMTREHGEKKWRGSA
jgi:hypothetical protein